MPVKTKPDGFHNVTPFLLVDGAEKLIDFCKRAFDATELHRTALPGGMIMHAQIKVGDSIVMVADARPECPAMHSAIYLYVADTDASHARAVAAGARSIMPPADQFYGDRNAGVIDPTGITWWIATHVEDVAPDEAQRRMEARLAK